MYSPQSGADTLRARMSRLADAQNSSHATLSAAGITVDVKASGEVIGIHLAFDIHQVPDFTRLGQVITTLINRARTQAQQEITQLVREVRSDQRMVTVLENAFDAPERDRAASSPTEAWDDEYWERQKSPFAPE
ncbi:Uncharacterised protein [Nocardia otitidiscaviarum]|uniref:YbaB/EbfC family nucleoid-associated protein n=2 Tax=Nocardia otitidiscaviarum TaxID=1823 RepID=A0A378YF22_9NOCA|nr:Uncharacterised protein [Nocardia otitidiscaviarum]